jgi:predicted ATP-dependent endonuclease of OLD family
MELKEIEITAYRSVLNQTIPINEKCIGFVGLNESGKTNILNSIRFLDNTFVPTVKDKSKINDALPKVRFGFDISSEANDIANQYCQKALIESNQIPYSSVFKKFKVLKYNAYRQLEKEKEEYKKVKRYNCIIELELNGEFYRPKEGAVIPADTTTQIEDKVINLSKVMLLKKEHLPEAVVSLYELANDEYIRKIIVSLLYQHFENKMPQVVYWEYDSQYLLPSDITYEAFIKDSDPYSNCAPLYNIFLISRRLGINDEEELIGKIKDWKKDSSIRRKDATILTEDLNAYIKKIWHDFDQSLKIELEETKITIHIHDPESEVGNYYEMESRSQGFKTFISFMLTIAAEMETEILSNCILLLDEPETHLHPSGVRFMRDELMKLSKDNYVFYATHSIFMIDRSNICRHVIVKKDSEQTRITVVDRNNFIQESVIYEALGTTVDEFSIRNKNIIFEGKMDLILFEYFIKHCMTKRGNIFLEYELHDGGGCKNIINFFKNKTIPKESEWIIVLDNDVPGKNVPSEVKKTCLDVTNIKYIYYSTCEGYELEDILPEILIKDSINRIEAQLAYAVKVGFVIDPKRTISKNIIEYRYHNGLDANSEFEGLLKSILTDIIREKIDSIKETTISKKREAFKSIFPKYYELIKTVIEEKGIKIEEIGEI